MSTLTTIVIILEFIYFFTMGPGWLCLILHRIYTERKKKELIKKYRNAGRESGNE